MSSIICPSCHMAAPAGAIFCDNCGYDLRTINASATPPIPPTQLVTEFWIGRNNLPQLSAFEYRWIGIL